MKSDCIEEQWAGNNQYEYIRLLPSCHRYFYINIAPHLRAGSHFSLSSLLLVESPPPLLSHLLLRHTRGELVSHTESDAVVSVLGGELPRTTTLSALL
jgi:hypothetical protein